jgi:hypothetical protein
MPLKGPAKYYGPEVETAFLQTFSRYLAIGIYFLQGNFVKME